MKKFEWYLSIVITNNFQSNIYLFKAIIETLEKDAKYVQS